MAYELSYTDETTSISREVNVVPGPFETHWSVVRMLKWLNENYPTAIFRRADINLEYYAHVEIETSAKIYTFRHINLNEPLGTDKADEG